jgi:drug/metabolite transporter (DMT)-like permease
VGRLLVFAAAAFWGTSATLARFAFRDRAVPPPTAVALRLAIAVTLLGVWLAWRRRDALRVRRTDWGYFAILGLVGVSAVQGTYYFAIARLGVGLAILLQYLAPALIVIYEILRGAPVRPREVLAVIAAIAGTRTGWWDSLPRSRSRSTSSTQSAGWRATRPRPCSSTPS